MSETTLSDVVGATGPKPAKVPTPSQIKAGSADGVAMATVEDTLDINMLSDSMWADFWAQRGVTRVSTLLWALVNQDAFGDGEDERFSLRQCQAAITGANLPAYIEALLRAYGQDGIAQIFRRQVDAQADAIEAVLSGEDSAEVDAAQSPLEKPKPQPRARK